MRRRYIINAKNEPFNSSEYFTIEALEDNFSVEYTKDIEYGIDGCG